MLTRSVRQARGFTLLELMVAVAIGALLVGLGAPAAMRLHATMEYRDAVRGLQSAAAGARLRALNAGRAMDLFVEPEAGRYDVQPVGKAYDRDEATALGGALALEVKSARQLTTEEGVAVIRFYADGSSSGGSITVTRAGGDGVRLRVDWLLGRVTQEAPEPT